MKKNKYKKSVLGFCNLVLFITMVQMSGCSSGGRANTPQNKDEYIDEFSIFMAHVSEGAERFTKADWQRNDSIYKVYTGSYYQAFDTGFSDADLKKIGALKAEYMTLKANSFFEDVKRSAKQAEGALDAIRKKIEE